MFKRGNNMSIATSLSSSERSLQLLQIKKKVLDKMWIILNDKQSFYIKRRRVGEKICNAYYAYWIGRDR